jgi:hypothetical protein
MCVRGQLHRSDIGYDLCENDEVWEGQAEGGGERVLFKFTPNYAEVLT